MKYINYKRKFLWAFLAALLAVPIQAQTYIEYNAPVTISNGTVDEYNYVFIGPGAAIIVEQDWYVLAQNIYIHPDAVITGAGTIHIMDAGAFGNFPNGITTLDGGGVTINAQLSIENPNNLVLNTIDPTAVIVGLDWTDPGTAGSNNLVVGNMLNFGADGGDVLLNNNNVIFTAAGNYSYADVNTVDFPGTDPVPPTTPAGAFLVTNGTGHILKQNLSGNFKFPAGITEGDYTPATISNPATAGDFFVQVKNYAASTATEAAVQEGMDRTWHIYSNSSGSATLDLQHNTATNGSAFSNTAAFATQYQGSGNWSSAATDVDYVGQGDVTGSAVHRHIYTLPGTAADNGSFFSKASDAITPLPVTWKDFNVKTAADCSAQLDWTVANEQNCDYYEAERSRDGSTWTAIGRVTAEGTPNGNRTYSTKDPDPGNGISHYRIRQVDRDGTTSYSTIRSLNMQCGIQQIKVYPVPNSTGVLYVLLPSGYEEAQVQLLNIQGQLQSVQISNNRLSRTVYLSTLPGGHYFVRVINKGRVESFKVSYLR